jgi:hypothetical protein
MKLVILWWGALSMLAAAAEARPVFDAHTRCLVEKKSGDETYHAVNGNCFTREVRGQIAKYRDRVRRSGKTLRLKLAKGRWLRLADVTGDDHANDWVVHHFQDYLEDVGLYVLYEAYYESAAWSVVGTRSGKKIELDSLPVLAPDGSRLAAGGVWCNKDGNESRAMIVELGKQPMAVSWKWSEENGGFRVVRWLAPDALELERLDCGQTGEPQPLGKAVLRRDAKGVWRSKDLPDRETGSR